MACVFSLYQSLQGLLLPPERKRATTTDNEDINSSNNNNKNNNSNTDNNNKEEPLSPVIEWSSVTTETMELMFELLQHFEIITRSISNHHPFLDTHSVELDRSKPRDGLRVLTKILHQLLDSAVDIASTQVELLERLVIVFLEIVQNLLDPRRTWKEWLSTWSRPGTSPCSIATDTLSDVVSTILRTVDYLDRQPIVLSDRQYSIAMQCLNSLGSIAICYGSQSDVRTILEGEHVWHSIQRLLGWPRLLKSANSRGDKRPWKNVDAYRIRTEYRLQLLALHVCCMLLTTAPAYQVLEEESASKKRRPFEAIVELTSWITFFAGYFQSDEESYVGLNAYPWVGTFLPEITRRTGTKPMDIAGLRKRITSTEMLEETPLALQELDLVYRLLASYAQFDLRSETIPNKCCWRWILDGIAASLTADNEEPYRFVLEIQGADDHSQVLPTSKIFGLKMIHSFLELCDQPFIIEMVLNRLTEDTTWQTLFGSSWALAYEWEVQEAKFLTAKGIRAHSDFMRKLHRFVSKCSLDILAVILCIATDSSLNVQILGSYLELLQEKEQSFFQSQQKHEILFVSIFEALHGASSNNTPVFAKAFYDLDGMTLTMRLLASFSESQESGGSLSASFQALLNFLSVHLLDRREALVHILQKDEHVELLMRLAFHSNVELQSWGSNQALNLIATIPFLPTIDQASHAIVYFLEQFCRDTSTSPDTLQELRKVIRKFRGSRNLHMSFAKSQVLDVVLKLLDVKTPISSASSILWRLEIVETLTMMMAASPEVKHVFLQGNLYSRLATYLESSDINDPALVNALTGMWLDRETWKPSMQPELLRNPASLHVLLYLYPAFHLNFRLIILERLSYLLSKNVVNLSLLTKQMKSSTLLETFIDRCLCSISSIEEDEMLHRILGSIMNFSISLGALKRILLMIDQTEPGSGYDSTKLALLKSVHHGLRMENPYHEYFSLTGLHSGMLLPGMNVASSEGYSFAFCLRINTLDEEKVKLRSWNVFECEPAPAVSSPNFGRPKLQGHVASDSQRSDIVLYTPRLVSFVSSDHQNSWEGFFQDGTLKIVIRQNGTSFEMNTGFAPELHRWYHLAIAHESPKNKAMRALGRKSSLLMFVDGELYHQWKVEYPSDFLYDLCSIGARCSPNERIDNSLESLQHCLSADIACAVILDHALSEDEAKLMASTNTSALHIEPETRTLVLNGDTKFSGRLFIHPCSFEPQSSTCFNMMFVPSQADAQSPSTPTSTASVALLQNIVTCLQTNLKNSVHACGGVSLVLRWLSLQPRHSALLINLLEQYFLHSIGNWKEFLAKNGASAMMHALKYAPPLDIQVSLVDALSSLTGQIRKTYKEKSVDFCRTVWFDFGFWPNLSFETQKKYLSKLRGLYQSDPDLRHIFGVKFLLLRWKLYYLWPSKVEHLSQEMTTELRSDVLALMDFLLTENGQVKDVQELVQMAIVSEGDSISNDILSLLLSNISAYSNGYAQSHLQEVFKDQSVLLNLLQNPSEVSRVLSLKLLECWALRVEKVAIYEALRKGISAHQVTSSMLEVLKRIAKGAYRNNQLNVPHVCLLLVNTLNEVVSEDMASEILSFLKISLEENNQNAVIFRSRLQWLPALAKFASVNHGVTERQKLVTMSLSVVAEVFVQLAYIDIDAWRILEDFSVLLWQQSERVKGAPLIRELISRALEVLLQHSEDCPPTLKVRLYSSCFITPSSTMFSVSSCLPRKSCSIIESTVPWSNDHPRLRLHRNC